MTSMNIEKLTRTLRLNDKETVVIRPSIALVLYTRADLEIVMKATAYVLSAYLDYVPPRAIASIFQPGEDEYTPGRWKTFDAAMRQRLIEELQSGIWIEEYECYSFVLASTLDGQAGDFGVTFGGLSFAANDDEDQDNETSLLRLEFPWYLRDTPDVNLLVDFIIKIAGLFPFCSGNAGMSFNHTIAYVPEARNAIQKLLPRFLGFDSAYDSSMLEMRSKSPPAHWLNFLDEHLIAVLGGLEKLRLQLDECEVIPVGNGIIIRSAKVPPVVDVNRGGLDIGRLPIVAHALKPVRFDEASFVGLPDEISGQNWLERFDKLTPRDWNND